MRSLADTEQHGFDLADRKAGLFRDFLSGIQIPVAAEEHARSVSFSVPRNRFQACQNFLPDGRFLGAFRPADAFPQFLQCKLDLPSPA